MLLVFSALAMAQAPSGKWTGNAAPNIGRIPLQSQPVFELVARTAN
jgi:hypothetical protein